MRKLSTLDYKFIENYANDAFEAGSRAGRTNDIPICRENSRGDGLSTKEIYRPCSPSPFARARMILPLGVTKV